MKQFFKFSRAFIAIALMLGVWLPTHAHDFEVDGIYYLIDDETAKTVTVSYKGNYPGDYSNDYNGTVTIPSQVTYSGTTYSVTSIGSYAFNYCRGLISVTIPNSVTSIGFMAFQDCYGLTSVTIPNSVTTIGGYAFYFCAGLTEVIIGDSVTTIGDKAFYDCYRLTEVAIPNSVTTIGSRAFSKCTGLTSVTIPNSVTTIGDYAFIGCSGLKTIIVESGNTIYDSRNSCNAIIETSTNTLIYGCKNSIIPNSVTTIGDYAFESCDGLTKITIPNSVTTIGDDAFGFCKGLTSVTIGNSVTTIGRSAFYCCDGLTSVAIPNSVTTIGEYAFYCCDGLTEVTIGNSVTTIGDYAFGECECLTSVTIPNSVTSIGDKAFYDCECLTSVTIGNSVTEIGEEAFYRCAGLKTIVSLNPTPPTCASSSSLCNYSSATLYVPKDGCAKYFIDDVWGDFANIQKIEPLVSSIKLNNTTIELDKGETTTLSATVSPSNAIIKDIIWESTNPQVAMVDQLGKVTALSAGTATITATAIDGSGVSASCNVVVKSVETKITLSQTEANLPVNEIMTLTYTVTPSNTPVEWSTSNQNVAYIKKNADNSVTVVGMADGEAIVTATATDGSGVSASCKIIVGLGGVEGIEADNNAVEVGRYDIHGRLLSEPTKGINIIKMSDGSTRKEFVK